MEDWFQEIDDDFSNNIVNDIAYGNGSKLPRRFNNPNLRNDGEKGCIEW